nr:serine/threonine protein kinase [Deltaproteobacteria bacterium]
MPEDSDPADRTKREVPARKGWMAPTVDAGSIAPSRDETGPIKLAISVFDPPEDRFVEKTELGRGGMGRVVEAIDRALGRSVAIKQSLASASSDLARFEREVRITAQLQHPSVIPILDVGRDEEGRPFYIMRKIEGEPLSTRVEAAATTRDRVALVASLLGAVDATAYAHAHAIIHRDIKPWNILLGPFGETLLIDWGIARRLDETDVDVVAIGTADTNIALTLHGVAQGTPGFLAPEQARGEVVDARADVYSLGATLFYVLSGKVPFGRIEASEAIAFAAAGESPDFTWIPDDVPRELTAIAAKALAPEPRDRYPEAGAMAADLRRFFAGQLVVAHDYSTRERLVRWLRKHRVAATVTALALVAIAIVSVVSIRQVLR